MTESKRHSQCLTADSERGVRLLFLALGTNLGQREELMNQACGLIAGRIGPIVARSRNFITRPVGFVSENLFLNAVVAVKTDLQTETILDLTQEMEREMGRTQKSVDGIHYDRPMDIDLLFYGDEKITNDRIVLPHAHLHKRRFVLEPLCDIAPDWIHPTMHLTMKQLLDQLNIPHVCEIRAEDCTTELLDTLNRLLLQLTKSAQPLSMKRLQQIADTTHIHLFIVLDELKEVCGMATLTVDPLLTGTKAWIEDVVIDSRYRGRGYAGKLISVLKQTAVEQGASSVNLTSKPAREAANRLYRKCGFVQRETNVYKWTCTKNQD